MKYFLTALAGWCRLMASETPGLSNRWMFYQCSAWWKSCHAERNQSCMTHRPDHWKYVKDWECGWYWMSDEGEIQE